MTCTCYRCTKENAPPDDPSIPYINQWAGRMFLCAKCGCKRCPHAADHRLACTNSNEPGQKGSLYENV